MLTRANGLCERLDAALLGLTRIGIDTIPDNAMAALRQRLVALASRLGA